VSGSYLLISPVDLLRYANNREHHLLRHVGARFDKVQVVYRRACGRGGFLRLLGDVLVPRIVDHGERDGVHYIEVSPVFNHYQGLAMDIAGTYEMRNAGARKIGWRQRVYRLVSGFGLIKDLSYMAFLLGTVLIKIRGRVDVCTAMGPHSNTVAYLLKRLGKVRVWAYEDRDYEAGFFNTSIRHRFTEWLEKACLARADVRVCMGYRLARLREQQTGKLVQVITTGVDVSRFRASSPSLERPVLIYIGNVTFWSGLEVAVRALPSIRARIGDVRLRIVGPWLPGYKAVLDRAIEDCSVADAVEFAGPIENASIPDVLARATVGLSVFAPLPFREYAFPLKVLEYMAAGLPVIGSKHMETEDIVRRHDCGICVEHNPGDFGRACAALLSDPERYHRLARNGRAAVAAYDWPTLMGRDYELVSRALSDLAPSQACS